MMDKSVWLRDPASQSANNLEMIEDYSYSRGVFQTADTSQNWLDQVDSA